MKYLLRAAFLSRKHLVLMVFTLLATVCFIAASQLEIFSLGVLVQKGPDFFQLFGKIEDGTLMKADEVSYTLFNERWRELDPQNTGVVTTQQVAHFVNRYESSDRIDRAISYVDSWFHVTGNIRNLIIFIVIVALFKAVALFFHRFISRVVAIRVNRDLRQTYFEHLQSLPMEFFGKFDIGSLSARIGSDSAVIADALTSTLINYFQTPITLISTLTLCFMTSWQLTIWVFLGLPLILTPIVLIAKKVKQISKQMQRNQESFAGVLIDFLAGIQTVKVFAMEDFSLKKYREHNHKMAKLEQKGARYDLSSRPIVHTIGVLCLAATMIYGLYGLNMSVSEILVYSGFLSLFYEPIKKFTEENNQIQRGIAAAERMFEVLNIKPVISDAPDAIELKGFEDRIEFDNVWFRYGEQWVLKGLSFTVEKGQTVAIVGPTGAGKSTIVQLLPRLYEVQKGEIRVDGKPINAYTQKSLRELIGFVPQKPFLFMDTVAENISFGRPFGRERVLHAAKRGQADEFIQRMPNGYESLLSEMGKNLSGGQQQRLAISRALVKQAPILVMDEATSSLDSISENKIKQALSDLHGEVTQIIIAHRLTTIEDADKIIYLEHGEKVAEGTKNELLQSCAGFRHMWEALHRPQRTEYLTV